VDCHVVNCRPQDLAMTRWGDGKVAGASCSRLSGWGAGCSRYFGTEAHNSETNTRDSKTSAHGNVTNPKTSVTAPSFHLVIAITPQPVIARTAGPVLRTANFPKTIPVPRTKNCRPLGNRRPQDHPGRGRVSFTRSRLFLFFLFFLSKGASS
jgi:hypothetical protein